MSNCAIVFDSELTSETLRSTKTNNLNDLMTTTQLPAHCDESMNGTSKIISIQALNGKLNLRKVD